MRSEGRHVQEPWLGVGRFVRLAMLEKFHGAIPQVVGRVGRQRRPPDVPRRAFTDRWTTCGRVQRRITLAGPLLVDDERAVAVVPDRPFVPVLGISVEDPIVQELPEQAGPVRLRSALLQVGLEARFVSHLRAEGALGHLVVVGVLPGHDRGTRGTADRGGPIGVREVDARVLEPVDRLGHRLLGQGSLGPLVVGDDQEDVRRRVVRRGLFVVRPAALVHDGCHVTAVSKAGVGRVCGAEVLLGAVLVARVADRKRWTPDLISRWRRARPQAAVRVRRRVDAGLGDEVARWAGHLVVADVLTCGGARDDVAGDEVGVGEPRCCRRRRTRPRDRSRR